MKIKVVPFRVVKTSAEALHHNLALLFVLPSLSVLLVLFCAPFVVFMGYAYTNGELVTNPELVDHPTSQCARGTDTSCCVWEPAAWVMSYEYLSGFTILWAAMIMAQIQVFTVSGTISQWYFAQAGSSAVNATRRALRYAAFFQSICNFLFFGFQCECGRFGVSVIIML